MKKPKEPKKPLWRVALHKLTDIVIGFVLGTILGQPLLALLWSPKAQVNLEGIQHNYCTAYYIFFSYAGSIDAANFSIRFPSRLTEHFKIGVPENKGTDQEHFLLPLVGDINFDACMLGPGGNPVDTGGVTSSIIGNTVFVRAASMNKHSPVMGLVMSPLNESTMTPAPAKPEFVGEYTYNLFGVSIQRPIKFVDTGVSMAK